MAVFFLAKRYDVLGSVLSWLVAVHVLFVRDIYS